MNNDLLMDPICLFVENIEMNCEIFMNCSPLVELFSLSILFETFIMNQ